MDTRRPTIIISSTSRSRRNESMYTGEERRNKRAMRILDSNGVPSSSTGDLRRKEAGRGTARNWPPLRCCGKEGYAASKTTKGGAGCCLFHGVRSMAIKNVVAPLEKAQ